MKQAVSVQKGGFFGEVKEGGNEMGQGILEYIKNHGLLECGLAVQHLQGQQGRHRNLHLEYSAVTACGS